MVNIELGEDLLNLIEIESKVSNEKSSNLKFDEKGSLHLQKRAEDGKLLEDIRIENPTYKPNIQSEIKEELEKVQSYNKKRNRDTNILIGIVLSVIVLSLGMLVFSTYL